MRSSVSYLPARRCAASKARLIEAGIRLFMQNAGQGLTTRELAREAKVNHALISYHFGGIAELLDAVVDTCIHELCAMLVPALEAFEERLRDATPDQVPSLLEAHAEMLLAILSGSTGAALLRALNSPDSPSLRGVYSRFSQRALRPLHRSFTVLAAKLKGVPESSLEASVLAQLMVAQSMAFFRGGSLVLGHLGLEQFSPEQEKEITRIVAFALCKTAGFAG